MPQDLGARTVANRVDDRQHPLGHPGRLRQTWHALHCAGPRNTPNTFCHDGHLASVMCHAQGSAEQNPMVGTTGHVRSVGLDRRNGQWRPPVRAGVGKALVLGMRQQMRWPGKADALARFGAPDSSLAALLGATTSRRWSPKSLRQLPGLTLRLPTPLGAIAHSEDRSATGVRSALPPVAFTVRARSTREGSTVIPTPPRPQTRSIGPARKTGVHLGPFLRAPRAQEGRS